MRGRKWDPEWDRVLEERFASERNEDLCRELGCAERTLVRHARALGLEKSREFLEEVGRRGVDKIAWMRLCGMRVGGAPKGRKGGSPGSFKKGRRPDPVTEARRKAAIRARAEDERRRAEMGWARKTKWKIVGKSVKK